ncbi:MAG: hypothetical protein RL681_588 [Candidatus Parcubacteria bacterium]|jgi:drug/metabolite transporter (DMT)-like permease
MGVLFAFGALVCWGFGDFLIQRSTRKFGDWIALLFIDLVAVVGLLPFVWGTLPKLWMNPGMAAFLLIPSVTITLAALLDFEALRVGKISIVEPIYALEVPITALLATFVAREFLAARQVVLIGVLMVGIFLVATRSFRHFRNIHLERGALLALFATIGMGVTNFLFGIGARETDPIMINWFTSLFTALVCVAFLISQKRMREVARDWRLHKRFILAVGILDNGAWLAYAAATLFIPIAIATGISESYIALAAALGVFFNKERLRIHQWVGLVLTVCAAIVLGCIVESGQ